MPQSSRNVYVRLFLHLSTSSVMAFQYLCSFFISPFNSLATIFTTVSAHLTAGFRTLRRYLFCSRRLQLIDDFNRIFASAILTFLSFLQLKYQAINDRSQSLFATHPTAMSVAIASCVVYLLAYGAVLRFPLHRFSSLAHHVLLCSCCVSVASLVAVTLPDTERPFVYSVFGLIGAAGLLYFLYRKVVAEEDEPELSPFPEGLTWSLPV